MEGDANSVGAAMASGRRVGGDNSDFEIGAEFLAEHVRDLSGYLGGVGVADYYSVGLYVVALLDYFAYKAVHSLDAAFFGPDADHLALFIHSDDGAKANQTAHRCGKTADSAASAEELQVVREEILSVVVYFFLAPFYEFFRSLSGLYELEEIAAHQVADDSDSLGIDLIELAFGVLLEQLVYDLSHVAEGHGHRLAEVEIEYIVSGLEFGLEVIAVFLFGNCACSRKDTSAKAVIEGVGVEFLKIYIRVCSFTVDAVRHTDELASKLLAVLKIEIAIRVYEIG